MIILCFFFFKKKNLFIQDVSEKHGVVFTSCSVRKNSTQYVTFYWYLAFWVVVKLVLEKWAMSNI
jgi:hypothetical protein